MKPTDYRQEGADAIEIIKKERRVEVYGDAIEIKSTGRPINRAYIPALALMLFDCSQSMHFHGKLMQAKQGALDFSHGALAKGYQAGLILFDDEAYLQCAPTAEREALQRSLDHIPSGRMTNIAAALALGRGLLAGHDGVKYIVLVTDGVPNIGWPDPYSACFNEAELAKRAGIEIIAIGTDGADLEFLRKLATRKELGFLVDRERLAGSITDCAKLLPEVKRAGGYT